jgi:hypothetical protein
MTKIQKRNEAVFKAKKGSQLSDQQAQIYGSRLIALKKELDTELLTAADVVTDARDPETPYHTFFMWNDEQAAEKYREHQARQILGSVVELKIVVEKGEPKEEEMRSFHLVTYEGKRGYGTTEFVFRNEETRSQIIGRALSEVRAWSARYRLYKEYDLRELEPIHEAIKVVSEAVETKEGLITV